ncbi:archaeal proteasome endopeptidase complex subunit alpha [Candidatus Pacearchaeota archaeon]|nr:MAG: archaeal proteasome endopeptidase complex subunit alpha [Candidatus Pacearchaeota archaeon]
MEIPTEIQHQAMGYDRTATMFSPDGHILQVEYAEKVVKLGSASIGFACKDGVVIVADKRIRDKLIKPEYANKIHEIDSHLIACSAGIVADARILIDYARVLAQQHRITYGTPIEPVSVIRSLADRKQSFTQYGGTRPYGVSIMLAGVNKGKNYLYVSDVSGNYLAYRANAIGENDEKIKEILRRDFRDDMTVEEAVKFALKIFKQILDKNFDIERFEAVRIPTKSAQLVRFTQAELKKLAK